MSLATRWSLSVPLTSLFLLPLTIDTAYARYDDRDAQRACEREIHRHYGYDDIRNSKVESGGNHKYTVRGEVRIHGGRDQRYVCKVSHEEITSLKLLDLEHHDGSSGHDSKTAAAIGVGVLGLAIVAAAASGGSSSDDAPYQWQDRTNGRPFDDHEQLKQACTHELRRHLKADHGAVDRMLIQTAVLRDRHLSGNAHVAWRDGNEADLTYDCAFDRSARIYDGRYHYVTSRSNKPNPTGPYTTAHYDATTQLRCSLGSPSHDKFCPAGITRGGVPGKASIKVQDPNGRERVLLFQNGNVTTPGAGKLTWGKDGDTWFIGIDNREFYVVPEAAVSGG